MAEVAEIAPRRPGEGPGEPTRPRSSALPDEAMPPERAAHRRGATAAFQQVANGRAFAAMAGVRAPGIEVEMSAGRAWRDLGQLPPHVMSGVAIFPTLAMQIDDLHRIGDGFGGWLVPIRWGAVGAHRGHVPHRTADGAVAAAALEWLGLARLHLPAEQGTIRATILG
jgi:hypothetical protein